MTKTELRILYLMRKHGDSIQRNQISSQMYATPRAERETGLQILMVKDLVHQGTMPRTNKNQPTERVYYWLTETGKALVDDLIARGELKDPSKETRGAKPHHLGVDSRAAHGA